MLVYANNCFAGFLYRQLNQLANHPFMWGSFDMISHPDYYINFISHYNIENFRHFTIEDETDPIRLQWMATHDPTRKYPVFAFKEFKYRFTHYIYGDFEEPHVHGIDVLVNRPDMYALFKYLKRLPRIPCVEPTFIVHFNETYPTDSRIIKNFCSIPNKRLIIVCRHSSEFITAMQFRDKNKLIIKHDSGMEIPDICFQNLTRISNFIQI